MAQENPDVIVLDQPVEVVVAEPDLAQQLFAGVNVSVGPAPKQDVWSEPGM